MSEQHVETLSGHERQVAADYVDGRTYKEIARTLGIAPATVRTHLRTVYRKLGVTSRIELAQTLDAVSGSAKMMARQNADLVAGLSTSLTARSGGENGVWPSARPILPAFFGDMFPPGGDLAERAWRGRPTIARS